MEHSYLVQYVTGTIGITAKILPWLTPTTVSGGFSQLILLYYC